MYVQNTLFLSVLTISAAGHVLVTHLSCVSQCTAFLAVHTCTCNCCVRFMRLWCLGIKYSGWVGGLVNGVCQVLLAVYC